MSDPKPIITTDEAAEMLGVTPRSMREWARDGKVPVVTLPSGRYRFRRSDIEALLVPVPVSNEAS